MRIPAHRYLASCLLASCLLASTGAIDGTSPSAPKASALSPSALKTSEASGTRSALSAGSTTKLASPSRAQNSSEQNPSEASPSKASSEQAPSQQNPNIASSKASIEAIPASSICINASPHSYSGGPSQGLARLETSSKGLASTTQGPARILDPMIRQEPCIHASSFIIEPSASIVLPKTRAVINLISSELLAKSGVGVYIDAIAKTPLMLHRYKELERQATTRRAKKQLIKANYDAYIKAVTRGLKAPYVVVFFLLKDKKMMVRASKEGIVDTRAVYEDSMAPLLPPQDNKLTSELISAIVLNGYIDITNTIAKQRNIELKTGIKEEDKTFLYVRDGALIAMLVIMFALLGYNYIIRKKQG